MKKIIIFLSLILLPNFAFGASFATPWVSDSTTTPIIYPRTINGIHPSIRINSFNSTSTTATSSTAYDLSINGMLKVLNSSLSTIIGDTSGADRSSNALDIQSYRDSSAQVASGGFATTVGVKNTASNLAGVAMGYHNTATGFTNTDMNGRTAIGNSNTSTGPASVSIGNQNIASTVGDTSLGVQNTSSGGGASAVGLGNIASGFNSNAFGYINSATGDETNAFGWENLASGDEAHVWGYENTVTADFGSAFGSYINNTLASSTQIGSGNLSKVVIRGDTGFEGFTGIGTSSPYAKLSVVGEVVGSYFTATTTNHSTFPQASTTNITVSSLTNGRVTIVGPQGKLSDDAGLTFDPVFNNLTVGGVVTAQSIMPTGCAVNSVWYTDPEGFLSCSDENLTFERDEQIFTTQVISGGSLSVTSPSTSYALSSNFGFGTTTPASRVTVKGDIGTDGLIPTLTGAGTGSAITVGSTDTAGEITEGTLSTGAIITFATAKARTPFCVITSQSGLQFAYVTSNTAITITNIGALSSTKLNYHCISNDL